MLPDAAPARADLVFESNPPGLQAKLEGAITLSGQTPLSAKQLPEGGYRLTLNGLGVATSKGRVKRLEGDEIELRPWAGAISLILPPGYVHLHNGEARRGLLFLAGGTLSAVETAVKAGDVSNAEDAVGAATQLYNEAVSEEAITLATAALTVAQQSKDDAEEMRNLWAGYFVLTWVGAALEAWKLTASPSLQTSSEGTYTLSVPEAGGWSAAWRSALVPGSGQRYVGRYDKGNVFTLAVMGLGAGTLFAHESFLDARRDQMKAQLLYDAAETEEEIAATGRALLNAAQTTNDRETLQWILLGATGAAYLWNIFDAYSLGNESAQLSPLNVGLVPTPDGAQAFLTWRLP